jgi:hypothetical protein
VKELCRDENFRTFQRRDGRQSPVSRNETIHATAFPAAYGGGQMKGIEGAKPILPSVACQQELGAGKIHIQHPLGDELTRIGAGSDTSKIIVSLSHRHSTGTHSDGGNRGKLHHRQARSEDVVFTARKDLVNESRPLFKVEPFGQSARIEEIQQNSVLSAFLNDQIRPGTLIVFQQFLQFFRGQRWLIALRDLSLALRKILMVDIVIVRFDDQGDPFRIVKRYLSYRTKNAVFENGFHTNRHTHSLGRSFTAAKTRNRIGPPGRAALRVQFLNIRRNLLF